MRAKRDIVRRVGQKQVNGLRRQSADVFSLCAVSAQKPVTAKCKQITCMGFRFVRKFYLIAVISSTFV